MANSNGLLSNPSLTPTQASYGPTNVKLISPSIKPFYRNRGYYSTGSTWEVWVTPDAPSTTPPSGHTLTNYSYSRLQ